MDLGAILLDPFDLCHLPALQEAIRDTCREYGIAPEQTRVAYSAHGELGPRIVVHVDPGSENDAFDPFLFLANYDGFGASLSGFLGDRLGEDVPTSTSWSISREHRTGFCLVAEGFYYTAEGEDSAEDSSPIERLASRLGVAQDLLLRLLQTPDTEWMPATSPPGAATLAELQSRLATSPLPAQVPRAEPSATFSLYLPENLCREAQTLAEQLHITLGELLAAAWETSKARVYETTPVFDEDFNRAPAMPAPAPRPLAGIEVPASAAPLPKPAGNRDKLLVQIAAPPRMIEEIQILARAADRAASWVMEKTYEDARARLHGARSRR